jgi:hypothetical protein
MDRVQENQELDAAIRTAESAANYLADLERQRDELPALKQEKRRRELRDAADAQMATATEHVREALTTAGSELDDCRSEFAALVSAARELAEKMRQAEQRVFTAGDELGEVVRAQLTAKYFAHPDAAQPHKLDRDVYLDALAVWGETWSALGGTSARLMAFPTADSRLAHALITAVANEVGMNVYHPEHPMNPFSRQ